MAGGPRRPLLIRAALGRTWNADFLTPTPRARRGRRRSRTRWRGYGSTPPEAARADLAVSLGGPVPPPLHRDDLPERDGGLAGVGVAETVLPYWPRRRRIIEADVVARTAQLSRGGWAAALDDMRPGMRWLGESRLQINARDYPPREISGARLMFVPVTPRQGWVSWDGPAPVRRGVSVLGGARGRGRDRMPVPEALGTLLGPARAGGAGAPRHPEEHHAAGGAHRPGPGLGGPPPQGPAGRPPDPAAPGGPLGALLPHAGRGRPGRCPSTGAGTGAGAGTGTGRGLRNVRVRSCTRDAAGRGARRERRDTAARISGIS